VRGLAGVLAYYLLAILGLLAAIGVSLYSL